MGNGVLKVALKEYGAGVIPTLYFVPESPLFTEGADATACASLPVSRKLLGLEHNDGEESCVTVTTTLNGYAIDNQPANFTGPMTSEHTICWYRNNHQATANITFSDLCIDDATATATPGQLTATVTGVAPTPAQTLSLNGQAVSSEDAPAMLFQNVLQAWGNLSSPLGPEDVLEDTIGSKLVKYYFVPSNATAADNYTFNVNSEDLQLQEGYYALSAKASVFTKYPTIVDLQGKTTVNQTDIAAVQGYTEYMGATVADRVLVGVQRKSTLPTLYNISCDKQASAIRAGDDITLTWQFVGVPRIINCYHDGELVQTDCRSPMTITAGGFSDTATKHVFSAVMTDVCGNTKNATLTYTATGVTEVTKADYVPQTVTVNPGNPVTPRKNAATISGPDGLALLGAGLVALVGMVVL
ncbi:hypothetical protein OEZ85_013279 [Tetradesmus obliquus]|uniref:Ig-like domain-containing protein n=1 Tax=Tetradesmus obliquus TaxID=3088 RepID=A0ABY8U587_TETOB|nr:hypothetical protein OEZ85_013279 [Tetradesmus obliquus]